MTLVIPSPVSNLVLSPGTTNVSWKQHHSTRCKSLIKSRIKTFSLQSFCLPFSIYLRYSGTCVVHHRLRVNALATSEVQPQRPATKSDMPTVKNEELVAGATFTGKVRSIQPFGAFVDFGAFTDGLVHLSQLSDIYVKDVRSVVSIGQEVTVKIVEANIETGRIALSMRGIDDITKWQNHNDVPSTSNEPRQGSRTTNFNPNRDIVQTSSKFFKRGDLQGIVKHLTKVGAFISLPEGQEGFLPTSEESDDGFAYKKSVSALKVGQEVSVHVLRVTKGLITLTMKREQEAEGSNANLVQGVVHAATNPFVRAFRKQ